MDYIRKKKYPKGTLGIEDTEWVCCIATNRIHMPIFKAHKNIGHVLYNRYSAVHKFLDSDTFSVVFLCTPAEMAQLK